MLVPKTTTKMEMNTKRENSSEHPAIYNIAPQEYDEK
jgi:hypothetical protein